MKTTRTHTQMQKAKAIKACSELKHSTAKTMSPLPLNPTNGRNVQKIEFKTK